MGGFRSQLLKLTGKLAIVALAAGAISLVFGASSRWLGRSSNQASDSAEEERRKRRLSEASPDKSPEHPKRPRTVPANGSEAPEGSNIQGQNAVPLVGSLPDMSAILAAKVAVPESDQADPVKLGEAYASMAKKFEQEGLNLNAVKDARKYYRITDGKAEPLDYKDFPTPLSTGAVRLGVLRLRNDHPHHYLADDAETVTKSILASLPEGSIAHCNTKEDYHMTVFMISFPSDPRPDPFVDAGGNYGSQPPNPIPGPSLDTRFKELNTFKICAGNVFAPVLEVHSVVFANSGTLLLLFVDTTGQLPALRRQLRAALPGASTKQPSIMHVTLARVLNPDQISADGIAKIQRACTHWTNTLRGQRFEPSALWHVQEEKFTCVNGVSEDFAFREKPAP